MKEKTYQNAVLLDSSPIIKRSQKGNNQSSSDNPKYFVYDTSLELNARYKVSSFSFSRELANGEKSVHEKPKRILLSPNKRLLMILGGYHKNRKCLLVYQMFDTSDPFHLIYYDYAFSYIDVAFTPDSKSLVCICTRHPHHLFVLKLPLIECPLNKAYEDSNSLFLSATAKKNIEHHVHVNDVNMFQPRESKKCLLFLKHVSCALSHRSFFSS